MREPPPLDEEILGALDAYLDQLQRHPSAAEMLATVVTDDFETGFVDGVRWVGPEGLAEFLSQREGFFDERHDVREILGRGEEGGVWTARTRLTFFLRRWQAPSPVSEEFTGDCVHRWRVRRV